jgi:alpha,alpha-trehalase
MSSGGIRLQAVILDMDGVVTDTARLHARAWKRLFDEYLETRRRRGESHEPFDPVSDYLAHVDGKPRYEGVRSFLAARGIDIPFGDPADGHEVETCCGLGNGKDRYFEALLDAEGVSVFDSTVARLRELRPAGVKTPLVTSSKHGRDVLERAGLLGLFDAIVDGNTAEERRLRGKPDPDIFLEAARELRVEPARAAVVEDAASGVEAARAGGFGLVVALNRGANREALERGGADLLVDDLEAVTAEALVTPPRRDLPSALDRLDEIVGRVGGRRLALFLDYDGTLSPIVGRPELAVLSPGMRAAPRAALPAGDRGRRQRPGGPASRRCRGRGSRTRPTRSPSTTGRHRRSGRARSRRPSTASSPAARACASTTARR